MNVKIRNWKLALVAMMAVLVSVTATAAQEPEQPGEPKPAGRGIPAIGESTPQDDAGWNPDTMPPTGLQSPTIGNPDFHHSYWVPGFQCASTIQSQPTVGGNSGSWYSINYLGANLSLVQEWSRSNLALNYSAGGFVTTQSGQSNGWYQQLAFGQNFSWRRWQMQILDQFGYLPQSQFGFVGGTGSGLPGIEGPLGPSVPGINTSVAPNQNIYTALGPQYSNSFVTQITYQTSQRGSITIGGAYGLLRFTQEGNVDSDSYTGNVGYNYQLTKEDSVGLFYRFTAYHYQGQSQALGDQMIDLAYLRKVTKRLALQIYGGPEITSYRVPVGNQSQTVGGNGGIILTSSFQNGIVVSGSYLHALGGGSGVLLGSNMDQVNLEARRRLGRLWGVDGNFGYAKNRPLASQAGTQGSAYNSIYVGGGVGRPIGRNVNFSLAYTAQIQQVNSTVCTGPACNTSNTGQIVTIGFRWHTRPFVSR